MAIPGFSKTLHWINLCISYPIASLDAWGSEGLEFLSDDKALFLAAKLAERQDATIWESTFLCYVALCNKDERC